MGTRGRDLELRLLTDLSQFDTHVGSEGLEDLADSAQTAARRLDALQSEVSRSQLDRVGDDAERTARKVERSFEAIARESRQMARKVDDAADDTRRSMGDIKDEASDTAREMFASFDGANSMQDAAMELSANVGSMFGPVGLAIGGALSAGLALFLKDAEETKQAMADLAQEMIDNNGQITASFIDRSIAQEAADDPAAFNELATAVKAAGVSWSDYMRAKYGDAEATERLRAGLDELTGTIDRQAAISGQMTPKLGEMSERADAYARVLADLNPRIEATIAAQEAYSGVASATAGDLGDVSRAASTTRQEWDLLSASTGKPIVARVELDMPSAREISRARRGLMAAMGSLIIPVVPGQSRGANTANNTRYRE